MHSVCVCICPPFGRARTRQTRVRLTGGRLKKCRMTANFRSVRSPGRVDQVIRNARSVAEPLARSHCVEHNKGKMSFGASSSYGTYSNAYSTTYGANYVAPWINYESKDPAARTLCKFQCICDMELEGTCHGIFSR
jgi:hypothetical protein